MTKPLASIRTSVLRISLYENKEKISVIRTECILNKGFVRKPRVVKGKPHWTTTVVLSAHKKNISLNGYVQLPEIFGRKKLKCKYALGECDGYKSL